MGTKPLEAEMKKEEIRQETRNGTAEVLSNGKGLHGENPDSEGEEWLSPQKMKEFYERTFKDIVEGEIIKGTVVEINTDSIMVDIGYKSEGSIPVSEFLNEQGELTVKVGDSVDVYLEQREDGEGLIVLSREKAEKIKIWEELSRIHEEGGTVEGTIVGKTKGGFMVEVGVRAFLPGSQVDLRPVRDPDRLIGKTYPMKVIKLNPRRGNVVLSRREVLEDERKRLKEKTLESLEEGKTVKGKVKNITEYGVFVDLGGIDGLLHITDISWGRVNHPSEFFMVGDEVEVVILKFDRAAERVSLGYKQRTPDPWEFVPQKYPIGARVKGKIVSLADYGAFVELEEGIEGLVHVSEMSWTQRVKHPSKIVSIGETVEVVVLDVDKANKRISLGMKQTAPDPWMSIEERYPVGSRVEGKIRNLTDFGAFIELEEGIEGLLHVSDMSWTKRIRHPSEVVKKGERIETIVLHVDASNRRISLGLKQAQADPWQILVPEKFRVGMDVKGKVVRITDFGAFVELEEGIEGLVHVSELSREKGVRPKEVVSVGQELNLKIIKLDADERKLGLSLRAYEDSHGAIKEEGKSPEESEEGNRSPSPVKSGRKRKPGQEKED